MKLTTVQGQPLPYPCKLQQKYIKKDLKSFKTKIKLKEQKQETKLANKEPNIKSKTN